MTAPPRITIQITMQTLDVTNAYYIFKHVFFIKMINPAMRGRNNKHEMLKMESMN